MSPLLRLLFRTPARDRARSYEGGRLCSVLEQAHESGQSAGGVRPVMLDSQTTARLLRVARGAIESNLRGEDPRRALGGEPWPELERRGVFVTLRKGMTLRGCIGTFVARDELPDTVCDMAVAASHDPRFRSMPISLAELNEIRIEISLLSPLERIENPLDIRVGQHGIHIKRGAHVGCFLPDVASDREWSPEEFLSQCCLQKAGLDSSAWRDPETEVSVFTVEKIVDGRVQA